MTDLLRGMRMFVTGGSRGIGAAIVRMAAREGADVVFTFRSGHSAAEALRAEVGTDRVCIALPADAADPIAMRDATQYALRKLGSIDVVVVNAGIVRDSMLVRMRREQWDEVLETDLGGLFNATQPLIGQLVKQRDGAIVAITSYAGVHGTPGQTAYAAAKAGMIGFTKALSKEVAPFGVRVNAVAPGLIDTDMLAPLGEERLGALQDRIGLGRLGEADDVASAVCFLASRRAAYITGQVLQVDGGLVV